LLLYYLSSGDKQDSSVKKQALLQQHFEKIQFDVSSKASSDETSINTGSKIKSMTLGRKSKFPMQVLLSFNNW